MTSDTQEIGANRILAPLFAGRIVVLFSRGKGRFRQGFCLDERDELASADPVIHYDKAEAEGNEMLQPHAQLNYPIRI